MVRCTHSALQHIDDSWCFDGATWSAGIIHLEQERKVCRREASPQDADPRKLWPAL